MKHFLWHEIAHIAFAELKKHMETPLILILPNFTNGFVVEIDASNSEIGVVYCQNNKPITYYNKKLSS